ncbi:GNAT family N-acetyltransferase [Candidatus Micrarchaeota archaeon]|nr:GNAT family N-acetyltransferase [Candidatus Micrarchaeota archaeon]
MKFDSKKLVIRKASKNELYSITVMTRAFFPYTGFTMDTIQKRLRDPRIHYLVALYEKHTVGFIDWKDHPKNLKIMGLAVLQEFQRRHIGERLLQEALAHAKKKKKNRIVLLVSATNHAADALYRKYAFRKVGKLAKPIGGQDVLLYEKNL